MYKKKVENLAEIQEDLADVRDENARLQDRIEILEVDEDRINSL